MTQVMSLGIGQSKRSRNIMEEEGMVREAGMVPTVTEAMVTAVAMVEGMAGINVAWLLPTMLLGRPKHLKQSMISLKTFHLSNGLRVPWHTKTDLLEWVCHPEHMMKSCQFQLAPNPHQKWSSWLLLCVLLL
jgi:hypothetical protein